MSRSFLEEDHGSRTRLELVEISKHFPGVRALDRVSFDLKVGEVHAICGENGAGKSTLMNILAGNHQPDSGTIILNDDEITIGNQQIAHGHGIGIVHQEKSLVPNMSVADNIFVGNQPTGKWNLIDTRKLHSRTQQLLRKLGMNIDSHIRLSRLPAGAQQMVEIAKALSREPGILILDEPTAALSEKDTQIIFKIIRLMARQGKSIIYISHRMPEIFEVADRVTVLKDGVYQGTKEIKSTNIHEIIRMMVGRDLKELNYHAAIQDEKMLTVHNLSGGRFKDITFDVHKGEILGFAGLVGAGRSEVARVIFGVDKKDSGQLVLEGKTISIENTADAIAEGIGYLPEDRKEQGLFLEMTVTENIVSAKANSGVSNLFSEGENYDALSRDYVNKLSIKTPSLSEKVMNLSGGNQQKIMLAKWLLLDPKLLIVDEPTAGVDVGTKQEIYQVLNELSLAGTSIILISSDMPELLGICDRILVFCNGSMTAELARPDFSEEEIMHYSSGTKTMFV